MIIRIATGRVVLPRRLDFNQAARQRGPANEIQIKL
jgi:hypothetical protein